MEGDATGGIIPYKNPKALIAYYLGILSGLPLIGLPLGIAAFILGFLGLRDRRRNPVIKGSIHAGIGIGCGCLFSLLWSVAHRRHDHRDSVGTTIANPAACTVGCEAVRSWKQSCWSSRFSVLRAAGIARRTR